MRWNRASPFETEATICSEFRNRGKAIVEQSITSEEINKSKSAGLWESQSGYLSRKVYHLSKVIWNDQVYQFHQNWLASTYDGWFTLPDGLIERISSMLDEIVSKSVYKDEEGDH